MHVLIYVPIVVSALAALGAWPLAERLPPRTVTWLVGSPGTELEFAL